MFLVPGAAAFSLAAFVGRLPVAMLGLGVVLLVSTVSGSYTAAGTVAAATMVGYAVAAPVVGRTVDRHGQRRVLLALAALHFVGLVALMAAAEYGAPLAVLCAAGALAGLSRPSTGTMVRTRWAHILQRGDGRAGEAKVQTAFSFEAIVDEVAFISGPVIVTALATGVHHLAGIAACLVMTVGGATAMALQKNTEPPARGAPGERGSALVVPGMAVIAVAMLFAGAIVGALELAVVAKTEAFGSQGATGPLLAVLAVGSMLGGLWYGARSWELPPDRLWIRCLAAQAVALGLLPLAGGMWSLAAAMFVVGLTVAPVGIAGVVLMERLLPSRVLTEGISIETTAMATGVAVGGWAAGVVTEELGSGRALALPAVCALAALGAAVLGARRLAVENSSEPDAPSRTE
ncbi:MFS transporter [Nocardiopsis baichengensis]|uniref:MFS transporter n=1 Tax=Nocardiopsis baichengensis TaxID=280240 RepID=UPI0003680998|nr:MFS transporter [Nocardiopsis baichengensis]